MDPSQLLSCRNHVAHPCHHIADNKAMEKQSVELENDETATERQKGS